MLNPYSEAWQIRDLIVKKQVSLRELADFFNRRIESLNTKLGAYMTPTPERALVDAARLEKASANEIARMPLYGIPYSLKDLTWTAGIKTTLGSKNFESLVPPAKSRLGFATPAEFCLAKPQRQNSVADPRPKVAYARPRAIRGTPSVQREGRAAGPRAPWLRASDRWPRAATVAARFASLRVAAEP
jgi:Amidase